MRNLFLVILFFAPCIGAVAQSAVTMRFHGGNLLDRFNDVAATSDSGYIAVGTTASFSSSADIYLVKCDKYGTVEWSRAFGGSGIESGEGVISAADTGYFVAGYSNSYGNGGYDPLLVYLDANGMIQWIKNIGSSDWDFAYDLLLVPGSVIICGETFDSTNGGSDGLVIRTDLSGNITWKEKAGGILDDSFLSICKTYDGNFAVSGYTTSPVNKKDLFLVKWDMNGDTLFTRAFGDSLNETGNSVIEHSLDSGLIAAGYAESFSSQQYREVFIVKNDKAGTHNWTRVTGQSAGNIVCNSIVEINNYELLLSGYTPVGAGGSDAMIYIATYDGWWTPSSPTYGGIYDEYIQSSIITADSKYVFAGFTESYGSGSDEAMIIQADSIGQMYSFQMVTGSNSLVGTEELSSFDGQEILVYPNPVGSELYYSVKKDSEYFRIIDLTGKEVLTGKISDPTGRIDVSLLLNGYYIIDFMNSSGYSEGRTKLIIFR